MKLSAICGIVIALLAACVRASEWNYDDQDAWDELAGSSCDGQRQSPINIRTKKLKEGSVLGLKSLLMTNWDVATSGTWGNNGHTLVYTPDDSVATSTQTHLGQYNLLQFHFHWGSNPQVGSEHRVNIRQYSAELHFVHKKAIEPTDPGDGYTVVGVLLEEDRGMSISGTVWDALSSTIPAYDNEVDLAGIVYEQMLPDNLSYYYYNGSLTTPLCDEVVQWVLLSNPVYVPFAFLQRLRSAPENSAGSAVIVNNFRKIQPLFGRKVYEFTASKLQSAHGI